MDTTALTRDRETRSDAWYTGHVRFARSIARGFAWTLISASTAQAGALLTTILAARLLGQDVFGALGAVQTTAFSLSNIASAGLGISATRYLAGLCDTDPARAGRIAGLISLATLITATALTGALLALGSPWGAALFGRGELQSALSLSAIYVFFATVSGYQMGALLGLQAYRGLAIAAFSQTLVAPALMYGLAASFGLRGAVVALDAAAVCLWIVQFAALRSALRNKGITVSYSGLWEERHVFSRFALPAACSGIIGNLAISVSTWIVVGRAGGRAQYAQFAAANSLRVLILFVPAVVNKVVVPLFAAAPGRSNRKFRQSFWSNVQLNVGLAVLAAGVMIFLRGPLLELFGKQYADSPLFPLLCAAAVLEVTAAALYQALLRQGAIWTHVGVMTLWSVALVAIVALLADRAGGTALALAYCVGWAAGAAAYAWFAVRYVQRPHRPSGNSPPVMGASNRAPWSLKALTAVSRLLPPLRGAARIAFHCIRPLYRATGEVVLPIWPGVKMLVDPHDYLGGYLAFLPQVYDRWERRAMASILRPGDVFVDVGSNLGAYALWAARCVGSSGRVLAIEPDPHNHQVLTVNVHLNGYESRVQVLHRGISGQRQTIHLHRNVTGNCGGHNFRGTGVEGPLVECIPLDEAVEQFGVRRIRMMKLDIEGFEGKVLERYFRAAASATWPEYLLVEIDAGPAAPGEKDSLRRQVQSHGYSPLRESGNTLFRRDGIAQ